MPRILAIANIKGGVGKTTTTTNLAAALAARGRRVLAVDLDPQASLTLAVGVRPDQLARTIRDALGPEAVPALALVVPTRENFDLIPANHQLRAVERELENGRVRPFALREALAPILARYEYVLLDCPANAGILTGNALAAASDIVIPFPPDFLALETIDWLVQIIGEIKDKLNPNLRVAGFLLAMYSPRTRHTHDVIIALRDRYGIDIPFFSAAIQLSDELREAPQAGQSVLQYAPQSAPAVAYRNLAQEIEEGIQEPEPRDAPGAIRRGQAALEQGDKLAAYRDFAHAIDWKPESAEGWIGLARSAADEYESLRAWAKALEIDPANSESRNELATRLAMRLSASTSAEVPALVALGHYFGQLRQRPEAESVFRRVTELDPIHVEGWLGMARTATDPLEATRYCERALAVRPNDPGARAGMDEAFYRRRAAAAAAIEEARTLDQQGQREQAHRGFLRAAELAPDNDRAWLGCARTSADPQEAMDFAQKALQVNPESSEAANLYHWLYVPDKPGPTRLVPWTTILSIGIALSILVAAGWFLWQTLLR